MSPQLSSAHAEVQENNDRFCAALGRRDLDGPAYDIHPVVPGDDDGGPDAFAIMTFDSEEDFQAVLASPEFAEAVADNEQFVDRFDTYVVGHIPVVDGAAA
jgi:EthD domain-containing protein